MHGELANKDSQRVSTSEWGQLTPAEQSWCRQHGWDGSQPTTWIAYADVNSSYPAVMGTAMKIGDYVKIPCMSVEELLNLLVIYKEEPEFGFVMEIAYTVPPHLHDTMEFAAPCKRKACDSELSQYQSSIRYVLGGM